MLVRRFSSLLVVISLGLFIGCGAPTKPSESTTESHEEQAQQSSESASPQTSESTSPQPSDTIPQQDSDSSLQSVEESTPQLATSLEDPPVQLLAHQLLLEGLRTNPLEHLFTLNSHGAWTEEFFVLPANVFVLGLTSNGFESSYTVDNHDKFSYEGMMFSNKEEVMLPAFTSDGWYLYSPGDAVRNVAFSPLPDHEFEEWKKTKEGKALLPAIKKKYGKKHPSFYPVVSKYNSLKFKVFKDTSLFEVVSALAPEAASEGPVLLIPYTCNPNPSASNTMKLSVSSKKQVVPLIPIIEALTSTIH